MANGKWLSLCFATLLFTTRVAAEDKAKAEPEPEIDAEFLEYLGSVESQDDNWTDFESSEDASQAKAVSKQDGKAGQQSKPASPTQTSKSSSKANAQ